MALDLLPFPAFGGSVNPLLQPPYRLLLRGPGATGPPGWVRRIGPFSEISHRLTSPMLRALLSFFTAKTSRTSAPFRVGYLRLPAALSAPLQGGLRLLRLSSTPSAITLPCGRASVLRRDEWGLPCCPRGRCDRGGCALSSGGSWCHRRQWCHLAIRPADLLVQATSLLGLFYGYGL
jgi:hypothetical protein